MVCRDAVLGFELMLFMVQLELCHRCFGWYISFRTFGSSGSAEPFIYFGFSPIRDA